MKTQTTFNSSLILWIQHKLVKYHNNLLYTLKHKQRSFLSLNWEMFLELQATVLVNHHFFFFLDSGPTHKSTQRPCQNYQSKIYFECWQTLFLGISIKYLKDFFLLVSVTFKYISDKAYGISFSIFSLRKIFYLCNMFVKCISNKVR